MLFSVILNGYIGWFYSTINYAFLIFGIDVKAMKMDTIHLDENRIRLLANIIVHYADDYFFGELLKKNTRESGFYHFFESQYSELMQWLWEDNELNIAETEYLLTEEAYSLKIRIIETAADQLHASLEKKGWLN